MKLTSTGLGRMFGLGRGKRLLSGAAVYILLGFLQNGVSFLLLPFFARALSPAEYGQVGVILTMGAVVTIIASCSLDFAVFRIHFNFIDQPLERNSHLGSLIRFLIVFPVSFGALSAGVVILLGGQLFGLPSLYLALGLLSPCLMVAAAVAPLAQVRAEQRYGDYAKLVGFQLVTQAGLKVLFVVVFSGGVAGWVIADAITGILMLPVGLRMTRVPWRGPIHWKHVRTALTLTVPLLPHRLAHWGLALSDRLVLAKLVTAAALGTYTLGYQIASVVGLLSTQINLAVLPYYGRVIRNPTAADPLKLAATIQILLTGYIGLGMALLGPLLVTLLLPPSFTRAADLIPVIALGQIFFGLYYIPMNVLSIIEGETKRVWIPTLAAALVNIGLNILLVPRHGIGVAAAATAIGYLLLLVCVLLLQFLVTKTRLQISYGRVIAGLSLMAITYAAAAGLSSRLLPMPNLVARLGALVTVGILIVPLSGIGRFLKVRDTVATG